MVFKEWFKVRDGQRFLENKDDKERAFVGLNGALNMLDAKHLEKLRIVFYGGITSVVTKTLFAPIERLKIELQTCRHLRRVIRSQTEAPELITYALIGTSTPSMDVEKLVRSRGIFGYMKHVSQNEGWSCLFRGNGLNIIRVIPTSFMKFAFFDIYRHLSTYICTSSQVLSQLPKYEKDFLIVFTSALLSGLNLTIFAYPLDLIRTRLTVIKYYSKYQFKSSIFPFYGSGMRCVRELLRHEGVFALWKGMGASMVGVLPYVTCSITTYEYLKNTMTQKIEDINGGQIEKGSNTDMMLKLAYGTVSSFIGKTISYPADTIRRRRQLMGCMPSMVNIAVIPHSDMYDGSQPKPSLIKLEADEYTSGVTRYGNTGIKVSNSTVNSTLEPLFTQKGQPIYKNTFHAFTRIYHEEGIAALFRGWKLNVIRVVPGHALHFVLYEQLKYVFGYDKNILTEEEDVEDDDDDL